MFRYLVCFLFFITPITSYAATASLYSPGNAPCMGVCSYEWALQESGAPKGIPTRLIVPAGSTSVWMSYGKNGKPYYQTNQLVFAEDEPGIGYYFNKDNKTYLMVKLDACENWTVVLLPQGEVFAQTINPSSLVQYGDNIPSYYSDYNNCNCCDSIIPVDPNYPIKPVDPTEPPTEPPVVPLPATSLLLLGACSLLAGMRLRGSRRSSVRAS